MNRVKQCLGVLVLLLALLLTGCQGDKPPAAQDLPAVDDLGTGSPVAISGDGELLLLVRTRDEVNEGWLLATDGTVNKQILEFESTNFAAAFSPDGSRLAWAAEHLWVAEVAGGAPRKLLDGSAGLGPLVWSPDGSQIVIVVGEEFKRVSMDGQISTLGKAPESVRSMAWVRLSAQNERLFYNSFPAEAPATVNSMALDGTDQRCLAEADLFAVVGDRLYLADPYGAGRLWVVDAVDGSDAETVVQQAVQDFAPRPTAAGEVVYLRQDDELQYELWLTTGSGAERQLTAGKPALAPLWSPDGQSLYFAIFDLDATADADPFRVQRISLP